MTKNNFIIRRGASSESNSTHLPPIVPGVSAAKGLSDFRRKEIGEQIERGEFRESRRGSDKKSDTTMMSYACLSHGVGNLKKQAAIVSSSDPSGSGGNSWRGAGGTVRQGPEAYSPLWLTSNTQLPRDRMTMNSWCRAFFALNPIVHNAISLHSTYPIARLNIKCPDKKVENFFMDMCEEMELQNSLVAIAQEYFVAGECFPYLEMDEPRLKWSKINIQNPDYIYVKRSMVSGEPHISLRPDTELRRLITSSDSESIEIRKSIPPNIIRYVKAGKNIPLDNFYVSHLARKISPYDSRGTSLIVPTFKALMLWDKLRECKYAQADNMINPITLVKIGGGSVDAEYKVTPADLEVWRQILEEAQYDKDFKIITHGSVQIEKIGTSASIIDINPDLERITKEIYIGLWVPQVIMESGDITYSNGTVSLDVLRQRYLQLQNMLSKWIRTKIFAPISELNDFWDRKEREKRLIIPDIEWDHMNMFDTGEYMDKIANLLGNNQVSVHSVYRSFGLDFENEQRMMRHEEIAKAIQEREKQNLGKMSLTELKSLDPDGEIPDAPETPVPGETTQQEPLPEGEEGGGGGEMGGGGGGAPPPPPPPSAGPPA